MDTDKSVWVDYDEEGGCPTLTFLLTDAGILPPKLDFDDDKFRVVDMAVRWFHRELVPWPFSAVTVMPEKGGPQVGFVVKVQLRGQPSGDRLRRIKEILEECGIEARSVPDRKP